MSAASVRHPLFARFFAAMAKGAEKSGVGAHRDELLADLEGRVIELGAGSGLNFSHYPPAVAEIVAVEPEAYLRGVAEKAATRAGTRVRVMDATADQLPGPDGSFDVGVASLVLCSVPDQASALAELYRVIRPGGELRFYEHVRAATPKRARLQDRLDRVWPRFGGGCHPNRRTEEAIEAAGFVIEECRRFVFQPCFLEAPVAPLILGRARRP